jgi:hypothetical protein
MSTEDRATRMIVYCRLLADGYQRSSVALQLTSLLRTTRSVDAKPKIRGTEGLMSKVRILQAICKETRSIES